MKTKFFTSILLFIALILSLSACNLSKPSGDKNGNISSEPYTEEKYVHLMGYDYGEGCTEYWISKIYDVDEYMENAESYYLPPLANCTYRGDGTPLKYDIGDGAQIIYFDESGRLIKVESNFENDTSIVEYEYNDLGALSKIQALDQNGDITATLIIKEHSQNSVLPSWAEGHTADGVLFYFVHNETEYDENGNKTKEIVYNSDGTIKDMFECEYDSDGNTTKKKTYDYSDGIIQKTTEYASINDNLEIVKWTLYDENGKAKWSNSFEYDSNGENTKLLMYDGEDNLYGYIVYDGNVELHYDGDGILTEKYESFEDGEYINIFTEYDKSGNIISVNFIYPENGRGDMLYYDSKGNLERKEEHFPDGMFICTSYDKNGKITAVDTMDTENKTGEIIYYDSEGNIIEKETYYLK